MNIQKIIQERERAFDETKFAKGGGSSFECSDYEDMYTELKSFSIETIRLVVEAIRDEVKKMNTDGGGNGRRLKIQIISFLTQLDT